MPVLETFPVDVRRSVSTLNALLRVELSARRTYEYAIHVLGSAAPKELRMCLCSHEYRIGKLISRIEDLGGKPASMVGFWSVFKEFMDGGLALFGPKTACTALESGEFQGLSHYQQAAMNIDPESCWLIEIELLPEQRKTHETLRLLRMTHH